MVVINHCSIMVDIIHQYWWFILFTHYPPILVDYFHQCFYSVGQVSTYLPGVMVALSVHLPSSLLKPVGSRVDGT